MPLILAAATGMLARLEIDRVRARHVLPHPRVEAAHTRLAPPDRRVSLRSNQIGLTLNSTAIKTDLTPMEVTVGQNEVAG